jgi:ABC-type bacteriocin/lantibiotic exporter with double-glycine peptidase domain
MARNSLRVLVQLLVAVASLCVLLAIYFFWLLVPLAGILLYLVVQYAFVRRGRRRKQSLRAVLLEKEAEARRYDLRRGSTR